MATNQMPSISARVPTIMCVNIDSAGRVNGAENKPLKVREDGIITKAIEIVFSNTAMLISTPCFVNLRLSLAVDTPPTRKMKMAI